MLLLTSKIIPPPLKKETISDWGQRPVWLDSSVINSWQWWHLYVVINRWHCNTPCDVILPSETGEGLPVSCNPAHRWDRETAAAYFLLAARRDCLWKINQRFAAPPCFVFADTHHINKLKLLDALSIFWLVFFLAGMPEKDGQFFIIAPFDQAHTIFSDTKGRDCAPPNTAVHFQDKYSCSQSVYRHIKAPAFSFYLFHTSTLSQTTQILHISESHFKHLASVDCCALCH